MLPMRQRQSNDDVDDDIVPTVNFQVNNAIGRFCITYNLQIDACYRSKIAEMLSRDPSCYSCHRVVFRAYDIIIPKRSL